MLSSEAGDRLPSVCKALGLSFELESQCALLLAKAVRLLDGLCPRLAPSRACERPSSCSQKRPCCMAMAIHSKAFALWAQVLSSDVGEVIEARLELLVSLVAYLLQSEINESVLKDGFPLPDIPHGLCRICCQTRS